FGWAASSPSPRLTFVIGHVGQPLGRWIQWRPLVTLLGSRRTRLDPRRRGSGLVRTVRVSGGGEPGVACSGSPGPGSPVVGQTVRNDRRRDARPVREDGILVVADPPPVDRGS